MAVVEAARPLTEIASQRTLEANFRRGNAARRFSQYMVGPLETRVVFELCQGDQSPQAQPSPPPRINLPQLRNAGQTHQAFVVDDLFLKLPEQVAPTGNQTGLA